jgi:hypothetical protein
MFNKRLTAAALVVVAAVAALSWAAIRPRTPDLGAVAASVADSPQLMLLGRDVLLPHGDRISRCRRRSSDGGAIRRIADELAPSGPLVRLGRVTLSTTCTVTVQAADGTEVSVTAGNRLLISRDGVLYSADASPALFPLLVDTLASAEEAGWPAK